MEDVHMKDAGEEAKGPAKLDAAAIAAAIAASEDDDDAAVVAAAQAAVGDGNQGGNEEEEEGVSVYIDDALLKTLVEEMGFPEMRAIKSLYYGDNNLEAAVNWLTEHSDDPDVDAPLVIEKSRQKSKLTPEEQKRRLEEMLEKARKEKAEKQKIADKQQELERIKANKEMNEAKRKLDEAEHKRALEEAAREKEIAKRERERLRAEIAKDKAERAAKMGKPIAEPTAQPAAQEDPNKKRLVVVKSALRKLYASCRYPEDAAKKAMDMAKKIVSNIVANPTEEKFRGVRVSNPAVNNILTGKGGGTELLHAVGFVTEEDRLVLHGDIDAAWLQMCIHEIDTAVAKGPFY